MPTFATIPTLFRHTTRLRLRTLCTWRTPRKRAPYASPRRGNFSYYLLSNTILRTQARIRRACLGNRIKRAAVLPGLTVPYNGLVYRPVPPSRARCSYRCAASLAAAPTPFYACCLPAAPYRTGPDPGVIRTVLDGFL